MDAAAQRGPFVGVGLALVAVAVSVLVSLGGWVVVGWEELWAVVPGEPDRGRQLGEATVFLPAAEPDALWLIDHHGGRVGTGRSTWSLVDASGTTMAEVASIAS